MSNSFVLDVYPRQDIGKGASRRLRREKDLIPGIIYGGSKEPQPITLEHRVIIKAIENEAFFSHILNCNVDGKVEKVVLKDMQRHPYKAKILHVDLLRVSATEKITMNVPIHFIGETTAPGVKSGGIISHLINELEVRCLPKDLPEFIEVDMSNLALDESVHLSDLKIPQGVELTSYTQDDETHDLTVASIHLPRQQKETAADEEGDESAADSEAGESNND